jgi:hypothetical protein
VYAARELRENRDHYYGSAATDVAWTSRLNEARLALVHRVIREAREGRASAWISPEMIEPATDIVHRGDPRSPS